MGWQDRISDAEIITPAGDNFVFEFRDLSSNKSETANVFNFPQVNGSYVQRLSTESEQFNLELYFSGPDCDVVAEAFEAAMIAPDPFVFIYPLKGEYTVQLLSKRRQDNLATGANEVVFNLDLHETIDLSAQIEPENAAVYVEENRLELQETNSFEFTQLVDFSTDEEIGGYSNIFGDIKDFLNLSLDAYNFITDLQADLQAALFTVTGLIDTVQTRAGALADAVQGLVNFPSRAIATLAEKLGFYDDLTENIDLTDKTAQLTLSAAITGRCQSVLDATANDFSNRAAVFAEIEKLFDLQTVYVNAMDTIGSESSDSRTIMLNIISATINYLQSIAAGARVENKLVLTRAEEPFTLVYRLLGAASLDGLEAKVVEFMAANNLADYELAAGTEVIYFT